MNPLIKLAIVIAAIASMAVAHADLIWSIEFNDLPAIIGTTDTVVIRATLTNSASSDENLGVIGGLQGQPPGFDFEVGAFASIPNPTPIEYEFQFGPEFVGNVPGAFSDQFEGVDLAPSESFEFVYMMFRPWNTDVAIGSYSMQGEIQLFEASAQRPLIGRSGDSITWTVQEVMSLTIDIKPGKNIKPGKKLKCKGAIPVAILGSESLDVTQIDPTTLSFEGLDVRKKRNGAVSCRIKDVNRDGYADFICDYQNATTEGTLTGELLDGTPIEGTDIFCAVH